MSGEDQTTPYVLGNTEAEHERLIRQSARLAPFTEKLFRDAGIGPGQRVLDLGSGAGDVAMLAGRLVGPTGSVLGVECNPDSLARAQARVAQAGFRNVSFTQCDVAAISGEQLFDAAVGRFILMFLPNPLAVLRSVCRLVRPGGVVAFQEPSWAPGLALARRLPLWHATISLDVEAMRCSGANVEMGPALYQLFQDAGLPAPVMSMDLPIGADPEFIRWPYEILLSLLPQVEQARLPIEALGDLESLPQRLEAEVRAAQTVVSWMGLAGAWSRKPGEF